jgi:pimeloyl-ACP methyl ester carboxylesterase
MGAAHDTRAMLAEAEQRLFDRYGLKVERDVVTLSSGPVRRAGVLAAGAGPPVVLLPGGGMAASLWTPLLAHLGDHRVHAIDLPGCGLSEPYDYPPDTDLRTHAPDFVSAVLDGLGLHAAPLVGNSLGGLYSLLTALRHPERVDAVALVGAPAVALPGARANLLMALSGRPRVGRAMARMPRMSATQMRRVMGRIGGRASLEGHPEVLWETVALATAISARTNASLFPLLLRGRLPRSHHQLTDAELRAVRVPTLLIWGTDDVFQRPDAGERAVELLPDERLEVVPGGHHPWLDDAPRCGELVGGFLTGVAARD